MRPRTALAALVAASVVVDLVFFTGFIASDDVLYTTAARELAETGRLWPGPAPHEARLLMIGWCALLGLCFRHDVQAIAASFVFFHQALTVLTFVLARPLQGTGGALLTAALSATFPLLVVFSTTILPDIPMTACLVAAFVALRAGFRGETARHRVGLSALSGASLGAAYLAKESGLVPVPLLLAMALFAEPSPSGTGDRVQGALTRGACAAVRPPARHRPGDAGAPRPHRILVLPAGRVLCGRIRGRAFPRRSRPARRAAGGHGRCPSGGGGRPGGAAGGVWPPTRGSVPGLWWILLFPAWYAAYYAWGSVRLTFYYAPSLQARYFIPCVPFLIVGVSVILCAVYERAAGAAVRAQPPRDRPCGPWPRRRSRRRWWRCSPCATGMRGPSTERRSSASLSAPSGPRAHPSRRRS